MSLKKTWFSYVLWFVLAGLTGLTTYIATVKVFLFVPWMTAVIAAGIIGFYVLLHVVSSKIKQFTVSKWFGRILHCLLFLVIAASFVLLRFPIIMNVQNAVSSQQAIWFYEVSKVGRDILSVAGMTSVFEQIYINMLSGLFLLLGNKIEVLLYVQVVLQALTFIMMIFIGWTLLKRVYAWIPALLYAVSPFMCSVVEDVGPANFWMCVVMLGISVICILQKAWKNRNITYIVIVVAQVLFGAIFCFIKSGILWYGNPSFMTGGSLKGTESFLGIEMLIAIIVLGGYCVSFWFDKQDHKSLYIIPFVLDCVILTMAAFSEYESCGLFMMLAAMNLYLLISESLRVTFTLKPETVTGQIAVNMLGESSKAEAKNPESFDWEEMQNVMKETDKFKGKDEEVQQQEEINVPVVDKKALIENVLPMPKKHTPKVLDYAFEPEEDQMHYDVEVENDEYDY